MPDRIEALRVAAAIAVLDEAVASRDGVHATGFHLSCSVLDVAAPDLVAFDLWSSVRDHSVDVRYLNTEAGRMRGAVRVLYGAMLAATEGTVQSRALQLALHVLRGHVPDADLSAFWSEAGASNPSTNSPGGFRYAGLTPLYNRIERAVRAITDRAAD